MYCNVCDAINKDNRDVISKIVNIPITSVKLNKSSITVKKGKTYPLIVITDLNDTIDGEALKWTSNNLKVVKADFNGKAMITISTRNGIIVNQSHYYSFLLFGFCQEIVKLLYHGFKLIVDLYIQIKRIRKKEVKMKKKLLALIGMALAVMVIVIVLVKNKKTQLTIKI